MPRAVDARPSAHTRRSAHLVVALAKCSVSKPLQAAASFDHGPEVVAGVGVEGSSFARFEPDLPHLQAMILKPQPGSDVEIRRSSPQFGCVVGRIESPRIGGF